MVSPHPDSLSHCVSIFSATATFSLYLSIFILDKVIIIRGFGSFLGVGKNVANM